jgi:branched-chain amino acid transport system ATP-binding protein
LAISGLVKAQRGRVLLHGQDLLQMSPHRIVESGVVQVAEGRATLTTLTVEENLALGAYTRKDKEGVARDLEWVYSLFPVLKNRAAGLAGNLSGGEQQMLAIGRALMTNPRLLILDEATEGLAPLIRRDIWNCLARLKETGLSILVIDKNVGALMRVADRHVVIERGRVVWQGASAALAAAPDVQHRYLGV